MKKENPHEFENFPEAIKDSYPKKYNRNYKVYILCVCGCVTSKGEKNKWGEAIIVISL